ncbi:MAG: hypothetical protein A3D95_10120 [Betaproteobacteria bacterium RIFCSPHIGHO2_12_FULL_69_13]|nr:MAG: hypothetical protein A3D95_10120 [Betaproteobacteria bacterium RIFCSPHIGHO2_12_FULL_69_13]OGA71140.1 MAG: hypothetical protein A3G83_00450 [Betaproteobacteria bacterium RIFCSPLOWO2_12_FULL_68_20]
MSVFGAYARCYDLLYRDKDYAAEAGYVAARLSEAGPVRSILDLGSGTGRHALELARAGFEVTGLDLSPGMVAHAEARRQAAGAALQPRLRFLHADARTARLGRAFDGVVALFHVLSYQTSDADVDALLATAAAHLRPESRFVFDFWYGPAVLAQKPEVRFKHLEDASFDLTRRAEPTLRESEDCVDVRYTVRVREKDGGAEQEFAETHSMRFFFLPAVEAALERAGFEAVSAAEMPGGAPLGERTWSACVAARRR